MMPDTYTKEQIENAKAQATFCVANGHLVPNKCGSILLSALSTAEKNNADWQEYNAELFHRAETAERERKELAEKYYAIRQADLAERNIQYDRAEKAEVQVAELEARLQGAGKQWETFARKIWGSGRVMNVEQFVDEGLSAIVGKKEG